MNTSKLNELISTSKLNKVQIAEKCGVSRTTLDNVLAGADAKISTIESLSRVLGVSVGYLFGDSEDVLDTSISESGELEFYKKEVERLQSILCNQRKSTKVVVELEVDDDEFIKMGLKDKVIQVLNK